jgi:citronellol/citronellal dehydrogenase
MWRKADIIADATLAVVKKKPGELTGQALLDEEFLSAEGETDFVKYRCDPAQEPPRIMPKDLPRTGLVPPRT